MAFPSLMATSMGVQNVGCDVSFTTMATMVPSPVYITYVSGLMINSVKATVKDGKYSAAVPKIAMGQSYVLLTKKDCTGMPAVTDDVVIAGPAIVEVAPPPPMY